MPVVRTWVAQDEDDAQCLRVDFAGRYIQVQDDAWQPIFGPNSALTGSDRVVRIAAEFDPVSFTKLRLAAYLYNRANASIDNASSCEFRLFVVQQPTWDDSYKFSVSGSQLPNQYFFAEANVSGFAPVEFDGAPTLMIEATVKRLTETYRDRIYVNHLGIYDSFVRLKQEVDFMDLVKLDE